jgi:PKD repeat protein
LCGFATGFSVDFSDVDGAKAPAAANSPPVLAQPANMTIGTGGCAPFTSDQAISATDPDGDAITFTFSGPSWMTVTSNPQVGNTRTGNIHLVSPPSGTPPTSASVTATAAGLSDTKSFTIFVSVVNQAPTLNQPANMTVSAGSTADQAITGSDACSQPLTFTKFAGPSFMTVTTTSPTTGNIHLAPSLGTSGTFSATVQASNGSLNNQKTFTITLAGNRAPVLNAIADMTVPEGGTADQVISATDPDGNPITFSKVSGPTYMTVTTTNPGTGSATGNIHLAPGFADAGVAAATVRASDGALNADRGFSITVCNGCGRGPVLNPIANMLMGQGAIRDQAISATDPDGDAITFTKQSGPTFMTVTTTSPTTGNIHLAPSASEPVGTSTATVTASDGALSSSRSFTITICAGCIAPVLDPIPNMTVDEGMTADQAITAHDATGQPLLFSKASGPLFVTVTTTAPGLGDATGNVHLAPTFADAGTHMVTVTVSNGSLIDSKSFVVTVRDVNRCPVAQPGGPYLGLVSVPVSFNGSASSDPDGDPLGYAWDFDASDGITVDATGAVAGHAYATTGTFTVTLTVTDNGGGVPAQICSRSATTTATIEEACPATVFNGYDTIRLGSGKPFWFAYVQPTTACYANSDVIVSSFVMKYAGRQISASGKTSIGGDKSGDGIAEIKISFSKDDLRALFTGTGLPSGHSDVVVTLEADLASGGKLGGTTHLDVVNNGNFTTAEVAPNPLNPQAILSYTTTRPGAVRIDLFNIQGRLVRRLVDSPNMAAGSHEAIIDGRGSRGEKLPSGVYYIRGTSSEGEFKRLITILK